MFTGKAYSMHHLFEWSLKTGTVFFIWHRDFEHDPDLEKDELLNIQDNGKIVIADFVTHTSQMQSLSGRYRR